MDGLLKMCAVERSAAGPSKEPEVVLEVEMDDDDY